MIPYDTAVEKLSNYGTQKLHLKLREVGLRGATAQKAYNVCLCVCYPFS